MNKVENFTIEEKIGILQNEIASLDEYAIDDLLIEYFDWDSYDEETMMEEEGND